MEFPRPCLAARPFSFPAARVAAGFSLLEVVLAVGLFATAVTTMLALLPMFSQRESAAADSFAAQRLSDAIHLELSRLAAPGFEMLAARIPVRTGIAAEGFSLVATRDASRIWARDDLSPGSEAITESECYFLVECWRFPEAPLAFDPAGACLVLQVRVSGPYRIPGLDMPVAESQRSYVSFVAAVNR